MKTEEHEAAYAYLKSKFEENERNTSRLIEDLLNGTPVKKALDDYEDRQKVKCGVKK